MVEEPNKSEPDKENKDSSNSAGVKHSKKLTKAILIKWLYVFGITELFTLSIVVAIAMANESHGRIAFDSINNLFI